MGPRKEQTFLIINHNSTAQSTVCILYGQQNLPADKRTFLPLEAESTLIDIITESLVGSDGAQSAQMACFAILYPPPPTHPQPQIVCSEIKYYSPIIAARESIIRKKRNIVCIRYNDILSLIFKIIFSVCLHFYPRMMV